MDPTTAPTDDAGKKPEDIANEESDAALAAWNEQEDAKNLVPFFLGVEDFGPKWLAKLSQYVIDDHDVAWEGSQEYRDKRRDNLAMLTGNLPKKTFPWDGCANAHMPVMLERYLRLTANVYVELFSDPETIFNVSPTGPDDQEEAEVLTLHGNWQLKNELTDFLAQQQCGVGEFFGCGSVFCHSYRDPIKNRNRHDILNCEELVVPFVWKSVEVDMSDVPYKIRILRKYKNELQEFAATGDWAHVDKLIANGPPPWDAVDTKVREKAAQGEGIRAPENSGKRSPWVLYEYHGWYRMPGADRERPVCVTVDMHSKTVVKLYIREENDWRDEMRFNRQKQEHDLYGQQQQQFQQQQVDHAQAMQEHQQIQTQEQMLRDSISQAHVDPQEAAMVSHALTAEPSQPPEPPIPPTPPTWLKEGMQGPEPIRRVPIEMFSHGVCFRNPNGTLGLSPGHILADLNRLNDEALNRFYDSATLANIWSLIVPEGLDLGSSSIPMAPGKVHRIKNFTGEQIKNAIHELRAGPANPQLMDIVRMVGDEADSSVAAPGVMSGEPGKSGETFRGISMRQQSATKQLSAAGQAYVDFLTNVLRNNARLNALFLSDDEIVQVGSGFMAARKFTVDPATGQPKPEIHLSASMYRRDYRVTFSADMRFSSQEQKISQCDEILAMIGAMPPLQAEPSLIYATVVRALRLRGLSELIPSLGPPPPLPTVPFGTPPPLPPGATPPGAGPPQGGPPEGAEGEPPHPMPPGAAQGAAA